MMTKKRFKKLLRAYFTRLNERTKANNSTPLEMGRIYKTISTGGNFKNFDNTTRKKWWDDLKTIADTYGIGEKAK